MSFKLEQILRAKGAEITAAKKARSIGDLKRMIQDTPPLRSFKAALGSGFGVIAEIKRCSPSMGKMRTENFEQAPDVYAKSPIVRAISVITDEASFGMSLDHLLQVKAVARQPVLRKDFIESDYGVYQARAFGADAVLLMASVLKTRDSGQRLFDLAGELGLDVLYEAHTKEEIDRVPAGVQIYGINSRNFMGKWRRSNFREKISKTFLGRIFPLPDFTTDLSAFSLIKHLPKNAIKVAESGINPSKISNVIELGYDAALIGTSLLQDQRGIQKALSDFEEVISPVQGKITAFPQAQPAHI
jgi:indole-3-glycerol phosphate synthase